ncbi:MAG: protein phosphatase 2C domain-containing protein [Planctomycetota bacterium]
MPSSAILTLGRAAARLDCAGATHTGQVRKSNQDQYLIARLSGGAEVRDTSLPDLEDHSSRNDRWLLGVADGMGGLQDGHRASSLALRTVFEHLARTREPSPAESQELRAALVRAFAKGRDALEGQHAANSRMGTTLTLAHVEWPRLLVAHLGDSRCYLLREGTLRRLTADHTLAQQLVNEGVLRESRAGESRFAHILVKALTNSGSEKPAPDLSRLELAHGDRLLLCSDGLTGEVPEEELQELLARDASADALCQQLIDRANEAGGRDNIAVVVARFSGPVTVRPRLRVKR